LAETGAGKPGDRSWSKSLSRCCHTMKTAKKPTSGDLDVSEENPVSRGKSSDTLFSVLMCQTKSRRVGERIFNSLFWIPSTCMY
jgi:hypothetical protein